MQKRCYLRPCNSRWAGRCTWCNRYWNISRKWSPSTDVQNSS